MKIEQIEEAIQRIKAMHAATGDAISWLLGVIRGEAYKAKKTLAT